ncbi:hypothetical protein OROMI_022310 [Orobanche minor]
MGLPEVADFARNFAVMVRVQGPDPKGLKMRNHAFHHYNSGKTMLSASGMLLPTSIGSALSNCGCNLKSSESVLVLTAASVIEPFILQQYRESKLEDKFRMVSGVEVHILMEGKSLTDGNMEALPWIPAELVKMVDIPQSSAAVQSLIQASCGSVENSWEVGWSLATNISGPQPIVDNSHAQVEELPFPSHRPMARMESSNPDLMGQSATRIALLAIPRKFSVKFPKLQTSIPKRGDFLLAMGSPFGILSPLHFFNKIYLNSTKKHKPRHIHLIPFLVNVTIREVISVGSIGNSYPPNSLTRSLLMADIRCLPGMEGSPVFSEHSQFIGLMMRPLRQKNSGTEVQMVIPWEAIACVCNNLLLEDPHITCQGISYDNNGYLHSVENMLPDGCSNELPNDLHEQINSKSQLISPVEKAMTSICLITIDDGSWASGVLLNRQGLVLTNAHLLEPWRFGKTAANGDRNETKFEVATIPNVPTRLETFSGENVNSSWNLLETSLKAGDFSLTNENALSVRSLNHRNIRVRLDSTDPWMWTDARIVYISKGPLDIALLQLDVVPEQFCPVVIDIGCPSRGSKAYVIGHGLFGPRCDILPSACLGVISKVIEATRSPQTKSNKLKPREQFPAMLETTAAVHPGSSGGAVVNSDGRMIGLVTSNAKHDMQDLTILDELDRPNEHLSSIWALMPPLYPRPGPSPDIPKFRAEDNIKDMKGSRFAKFMADRNELLKTKTQDGMARSFTDDLIPSKL